MENPIEKMENFEFIHKKNKKRMEIFEFLSTYVAAIDGGGGSVERVPRFSFVRTFDSDAQWCLGSWGSPLYSSYRVTTL
jgi:hypothetical protein